MKKVKFESAFPNGIPGMVRKYSFTNIPVSGEINTGLTNYGIVILFFPQYTASALIHLHGLASIGNSEIISDKRNLISISKDTTGRVCIFRKENNGPIFIQNSGAFAVSLSMYVFEP